MTQNLLGIYLNDHLAAARAGVNLFRRSQRGTRERRLAAELAELADQVEADRRSLSAIMNVLKIPEFRPLGYLMQAMEVVGRLKPNGRLLSRSPLADVIELEAMRSAVEGKAALWDALLSLKAARGSGDDPLPGVDESELIPLRKRAEDQSARLERLHHEIAGDRLSAS